MSSITYVRHQDGDGKDETGRGELHRIEVVVELLVDGGKTFTRLHSADGLDGEALDRRMRHVARQEGISPHRLRREICGVVARTAGWELIGDAGRVELSLGRRR